MVHLFRHGKGKLKGKYDIAKWHNLRKHEIAALDGVMWGDFCEGPVTVEIFEKENPDAT